MLFILFAPDGDPKPLCPNALSEISEVTFSRVVAPWAIFGVQHKSLKIAKPVKQQPRNLAGVLANPFAPWSGMVPAACVPLRLIAEQRRRDGDGIPAAAIDPSGDNLDHTLNHWVPSVLR